MQKKKKASASPLANSSNSKCLIIDLKEGEEYSQSLQSNFSSCFVPRAKFRFFLLPGWYFLREEIGQDEAEILRFLDYWIRNNFVRWKRPKVHWTYNKLSDSIRIPKRTLQRKIANLIKIDLIHIAGSGPIWFMINYDQLMELEKDLMDNLATYDAKLATYIGKKQ